MGLFGLIGKVFGANSASAMDARLEQSSLGVATIAIENFIVKAACNLDNRQAIDERANQLFMDRIQKDGDLAAVLAVHHPKIDASTWLAQHAGRPFDEQDLSGLVLDSTVLVPDHSFYADSAGGPLRGQDLQAAIERHAQQGNTFANRFANILALIASRCNAARIMTEGGPANRRMVYDEGANNMNGGYRVDAPLWMVEHLGTRAATTRLLPKELLSELDAHFPAGAGAIQMTGVSGMCQYMARMQVSQLRHPHGSQAGALWSEVVAFTPMFAVQGLQERLNAAVRQSVLQDAEAQIFRSFGHEANRSSRAPAR